MFEAFLRSEANIFITEDNDFLSVRQELIDTFKTQIMTLVEFGKHLESN
jgi:predicted nucleic acid-binding protein